MKNERGFALVITLAVLLIISLVGASLVLRSNLSLRMSEQSLLLLKAQSAADAGAEYALGALKDGTLSLESIGEGSSNATTIYRDVLLNRDSGQYYTVSAYRMSQGGRELVYIDSTGYVVVGGNRVAERSVEYVVEVLSNAPFYYNYTIFAGNDIDLTGSMVIELPQNQRIHADHDLKVTGIATIEGGATVTYVNNYRGPGTLGGSVPQKVDYVDFPNPLVDVNYWRDYIKSNYDEGKPGYHYFNGNLKISGATYMEDSIVISGETIPIDPNSKTYIFVDGNVSITGSSILRLNGSPELIIVAAGKINVTGSTALCLDDASLTLMAGGSTTVWGIKFSGSASVRTGGRFNVISNKDVRITGSVSVDVVKKISLASAQDVRVTGSAYIRQWEGLTPPGGTGTTPGEGNTFRLIGVVEK